jgi:hypothetical protein
LTEAGFKCDFVSIRPEMRPSAGSEKSRLVMIRFRRIAAPIGFLLMFWLPPVSDLCSGEFRKAGTAANSNPSLTELTISTAVHLSFLVLIFGLVIWGGFADRGVAKALQNAPGHRYRFLVLCLLAASSIPNLFVLALVANELGLTKHQILHLGVPILLTPAVLGEIWFRLQIPSPNPVHEDAVG